MFVSTVERLCFMKSSEAWGLCTNLFCLVSVMKATFAYSLGSQSFFDSKDFKLLYIVFLFKCDDGVLLPAYILIQTIFLVYGTSPRQSSKATGSSDPMTNDLKSLVKGSQMEDIPLAALKVGVI
jgi:hypothetical protein